MLQTIYDWIFQNYIELAAVISGFIYIYLSVRQNIWLWFFGIITSVLYIYVYFVSKFYADMSLQFYYVFISIYGWFAWYNGKKNNPDKKFSVTRTNFKTASILFFITVLLFLFYILILKQTDTTIPFGDAFTTSVSITATWMLTRKKIEHWILWIIVNIISIGLYFHKELYPTVILFCVYTIIAVIGYLEWKKEIR